MNDLTNWIAEQRAVCAVQQQRWEGVAPERLLEACRRLEAMQIALAARELTIAGLELRLGERSYQPKMLEYHGPNTPTPAASHAPGLTVPAPALPLFLRSSVSGPWSPPGQIMVHLDGHIDCPSPQDAPPLQALLRALMCVDTELRLR